MSATINDFLFKVVVRRVTTGSTPFGWEVYRGDTVVPLQVSSNRFDTMEAAYLAGRSKLADLALPKKAAPARERVRAR